MWGVKCLGVGCKVFGCKVEHKVLACKVQGIKCLDVRCGCETEWMGGGGGGGGGLSFRDGEIENKKRWVVVGDAGDWGWGWQ